MNNDLTINADNSDGNVTMTFVEPDGNASLTYVDSGDYFNFSHTLATNGNMIINTDASDGDTTLTFESDDGDGGNGATLTYGDTTNTFTFGGGLTNSGPFGSNWSNARNHFVQTNTGNTGQTNGWIAAAFGDNSGNRVVIGQANGVAYLGAHNGDLTGWANLVIANGGGYVGIGNDDSPDYPLDVEGSVGINGGIVLYNGSYNNCTFLTTDSSGSVGCGTSVSAHSGDDINLFVDGGNLYVSTSGDTMGGTLNITSGTLQLSNGSYNSCTSIYTDASGNLTCSTAVYLTSISGQSLALATNDAGFLTLMDLYGANISIFNNDSGYYKYGDSANFNTLTISSLNCTGNLDGGALTTDGSGNVSCSDDDGVGTDLAEAYPTIDPTLGSGEILALDPVNPLFVKRATGAAGEHLIGIYSTKPWKVLDDPAVASGSLKVPVALAGRVPVKVNLEGGNVVIGDPLTISSVPGVARKALGGEALIGYALEPFNANSEANTIVAFVTLDEKSSAPAMMVINSPVTDANTDAFTVKSNVNGSGSTVFRVTAGGDVYTDGVYHSQGADYAEWFLDSSQRSAVSNKLQPGEAVCIDVTSENAVKRCENPGDPNVMGIISSNPSFIGNELKGAEGLPVPGYVLVGLIGQVQAKAIVETMSGQALQIRAGDALTPASTPGYVRKAVAGESTVGVALQSLNGGTGTINVLISRKNQSLTAEAVSDRVLETVRNLKIEDELKLSLQNAIDKFSASGTLIQPISSEVQKQMVTLQASVTDRLSALEARLNALSGSLLHTGTPIAQNSLTQSGGNIFANNLSLEETLAARDGRFAGDLYVDGTFNVNELYVPNGIKVDGGIDAGSLTANTLNVKSDVSLGGTLTLAGSLKLGSGSSISFGSGSTLELHDLLVRDALHVLGPITIDGLATFLGDVEVHGTLMVSARQAGEVTIPKTGTSVIITFDTPLTSIPVVNVSPRTRVGSEWWIDPVTATGFTINIALPAAQDIRFSWSYLGVKSLTLTGATIHAPVPGQKDAIAFPVDQYGVPLSSNQAWNSCIRNHPMLGSDGQPVSCDRYHDGYTWEHPDLQMSFIWNTSMTPPLLQIPDGYEIQVTEVSEVPEVTEGSSDSSSSVSSDTASSESSSSVSSEEASSSSESSVSSESSSEAVSESSSSAPEEAPTDVPVEAPVSAQ